MGRPGRCRTHRGARWASGRRRVRGLGTLAQEANAHGHVVDPPVQPQRTG